MIHHSEHVTRFSSFVACLPSFIHWLHNDTDSPSIHPQRMLRLGWVRRGR